VTTFESVERPRFTWQPAGLRRHCYLAEYPVTPGTEVAALCGSLIVGRRASRDEWCWPTCAECYEEARRVQLDRTPARPMSAGGR
jgi:hypothetical protein